MSRKDINGMANEGDAPALEEESLHERRQDEPTSIDGENMDSPSANVDSTTPADSVDPAASQANEPAAASMEDETQFLKERVLRQAAEFQNFRRRVEQERKGDVSFGQGLVLQEILDVYDDLRRSIEAAEDDPGADSASPQFQGLKEGVELVYKKFTDVLQRFGVEPIDAVGTSFDEHAHEAMMQQPSPDGTAPGTVLAEIQKGYRMGDRILRHSKVVVSS